MALCKVIVKKFVPGWGSAHGPLGYELGLSLQERAQIARTRAPDGTWTSGPMVANTALNWGIAFEGAGCEVEVVEVNG